MARMLVGTRILDMTRLLPGPFCTQMLADLGAEVIKVETPKEGDPSRGLRTQVRGYGSSFLMLNRGKKSMTLNLKTKDGVEIFRRLAGRADVVVESFRPGVVDRLGIGYGNLKYDNRKLIYCSLTGYGQDGPYANRAGHDINFLSIAGLASLTGPRGGGPLPPGMQVGDVGAGAIMAAFAIMAALYHREKTGRGQYIDVSMLDGLIAVGQSLFGEFFSTGKVPAPGTMRLNGGYPIYGYYETKDGKHIGIGALEKKFWDTICDKMGRQDLKEMHRSGWDTERDKLEDELKKLFKTRTRQEWTELLADEDACLTPVLGLDEVMEDPHVRHRGMFFAGPHPDGGDLPQVAFPIKFSDVDAKEAISAPRLGEHTEEILLSVGYTRKEVAALKKKEVV